VVSAEQDPVAEEIESGPAIHLPLDHLKSYVESASKPLKAATKAAHLAALRRRNQSITDDNEEEQLRLGLGQVLRYHHHLERLGHQRVVAVLVPERTPRDASWDDLCGELGVILLSTTTLGHAPTLATGHKRPGASPGPGVPGV